MIDAGLHRLIVPLLLALLLTSCGGGGSGAPGTPTVAADTPGQPQDPLTAAAADLAQRFHREPDEVEFVSLNAQQWPDACLGLPEPGEVCAQVVTPGYEAKFRLEGRVYSYHTDMADNVRFAGDATPDVTPSPQASGTPAPD